MGVYESCRVEKERSQHVYPNSPQPRLASSASIIPNLRHPLIPATPPINLEPPSSASQHHPPPRAGTTLTTPARLVQHRLARKRRRPPTMNTPGASMPPAAGPGTADHYIIGKNTKPANPTPLSAPQEQQVRDLYYKNVRAKCATEIEGTTHPCTATQRNATQRNATQPHPYPNPTQHHHHARRS